MRGAAHADATPKPAAWEEENLKRKGRLTHPIQHRPPHERVCVGRTCGVALAQPDRGQAKNRQATVQF
jgi:hypothetical protein